MWDNGYTNSYRFGADGRFDIQRVSGRTSLTSSTPAISVLEAVRAKGRGLMGRTRETGGVRDGSSSPFPSFTGFTPFATKQRRAGGIVDFGAPSVAIAPNRFFLQFQRPCRGSPKWRQRRRQVLLRRARLILVCMLSEILRSLIYLII